MFDHLEDWRWLCNKCQLLMGKRDFHEFKVSKMHRCQGYTIMKEIFTKRDIYEYGDMEQIPTAVIDEAYAEYFPRH